MATYSKDHLAALLSKLGTKNVDNPFKQETPKPEKSLASVTPIPENSIQVLDKYGNTITLNEKQSTAVSYAAAGKSFVLIGAAGTGKTTCQGASVQAIIQNGHARILTDVFGHKHLKKGAPGIAIVAFTRRAVNNIKKALPEHLKDCCMTIHKLLQYSPVKEDYETADGETKTKMTFQPTYTADNPLPPSLQWIIYEESSMVGTDLYKRVQEAMPHIHREIFLGDLQQLPPVFGPAVLGFKLLDLPCVELTEVYRQALESPILSLAWKVLRGEDMPHSEFDNLSVAGKLKLHAWKKKLSAEDAVTQIALFFKKAYQAGTYIPSRDMILMAQNVKFGTLELNKFIATYIAKDTESEVFEVVSGRFKQYFRVGEIIMVDKEDAEIVDIQPNPKYFGKPAQPSSKQLNYWGQLAEDHVETSLTQEADFELSADDIDSLLAKVEAMGGDSEERVNQASHVIRVRYPDRDYEEDISDSGSINAILLGYALTVHKAQGSEWENVFFVSHGSNGRMLQRELLYTAVTRAKDSLYVVCEPDMLQKAVKSQIIKGNTLAEKAEFFKGKKDKIAEMNN